MEEEEEEDLILTFSNSQKCVIIVDRLVTLPVSATSQEKIVEEISEETAEEITEEDTEARQGHSEDW